MREDLAARRRAERIICDLARRYFPPTPGDSALAAAGDAITAEGRPDERDTPAEAPPVFDRAAPCPDPAAAEAAARRRVADRLICEAAARYVHPYLRDNTPKPGGPPPAE